MWLCQPKSFPPFSCPADFGAKKHLFHVTLSSTSISILQKVIHKKVVWNSGFSPIKNVINGGWLLSPDTLTCLTYNEMF